MLPPTEVLVPRQLTNGRAPRFDFLRILKREDGVVGTGVYNEGHGANPIVVQFYDGFRHRTLVGRFEHAIKAIPVRPPARCLRDPLIRVLPGELTVLT